MGKKKKSGNEKRLATILLITATLQLIQALIDLINHLLDQGVGAKAPSLKIRISFSLPIVKYGNYRNYFRRRADYCQHRNHCSVTQRQEMQIGTTGPAPGYAPGKEYYGNELQSDSNRIQERSVWASCRLRIPIPSGTLLRVRPIIQEESITHRHISFGRQIRVPLQSGLIEQVSIMVFKDYIIHTQITSFSENITNKCLFYILIIRTYIRIVKAIPVKILLQVITVRATILTHNKQSSLGIRSLNIYRIL